MSNENFTITENIAPVLDLQVEKEYSIDVQTSIDVTTNVITNNFPIMGYIYQPTDIPGQQVQVQSALNDYYYLVDESYSPNEVYWGPQPLSTNTTNDQYQPYRLK